MAVLVIPARYGSKRLPGKPLLAETGKPLIAHVVERAAKARGVTRVVVATDDPRIQAAAEEAGAVGMMTSPGHRCGTDRVAEVARSLPDETYFVNLQGDEPEVEPDHIDVLLEALTGGTAQMATLAAPLRNEAEFLDPSVVKVVFDAAGDALYFSRAPIPCDRDRTGGGQRFRHLGIYGFERDAIERFAHWEPSSLERLERLEQLRALENGMSIRVAIVDEAPPGIDTMAAYQAFVARYTRPDRPDDRD